MRYAFLAFGLLLTSCGDSTDNDPNPAGGTSGYAGEGIAWVDKDPTQRFAFMNAVVLPEMQTLFAGFDSETYNEIECSLCHGQSAQANGYAMPADLTALDPANFPDPNSANESEAAYAGFMMNQVLPKMTELLGAEPFNPNTGEGFSCYGCHPFPG